MNIKILKQYTELCEERKDLEKRISDTMVQLEEAKSTVIEDIVKGSTASFPYTSTNMHISGVDEGLVKRRLMALNRLKRLLEEKKIEILEKEVEVEEFLNSVDDSIVRSIVRYRYIDGLTWTSIGHKMRMSDSNCRMTVQRYMSKKC